MLPAALAAGEVLETRIGGLGLIRSVNGTGWYRAVLGLLVLGLGTQIRRTAAPSPPLISLALILRDLL